MSASVIQLYAHRFLRDSIGGTEVLVDDTARALAKRGRNVILVAAGRDGLTETLRTLRDDGVEEWHIPPVDTSRHPDNWRRIEAVLADRIAASFDRFLGDRRVEAVHLFHFARIGLAFLDLPQLRNARRIATLTDYTAICADFQLRNRRSEALCPGTVSPSVCADCLDAAGAAGVDPDDIASWRARNLRVLSGFDGLFVQTPHQRRVLQANGFNGASFVQDIAAYRVPDAWGAHRRPAVNARTKSIRFCFVGRTSEEKGLDVALAAFARIRTSVPEAELIVIGPLTDRYATANRAATPPDGVQFVGAVPSSEVGPLLAACDCILIPSLWLENHPTVLTYALSLGLSALCSDLPSLRHLADSGPVEFADVGDVTAWSDAMRNVAARHAAGIPHRDVRLPSFDRLVDRIEGLVEGCAV